MQVWRRFVHAMKHSVVFWLEPVSLMRYWVMFRNRFVAKSRRHQIMPFNHSTAPAGIPLVLAPWPPSQKCPILWPPAVKQLVAWAMAKNLEVICHLSAKVDYKLQKQSNIHRQENAELF